MPVHDHIGEHAVDRDAVGSDPDSLAGHLFPRFTLFIEHGVRVVDVHVCAMLNIQRAEPLQASARSVHWQVSHLQRTALTDSHLDRFFICPEGAIDEQAGCSAGCRDQPFIDC